MSRSSTDSPIAAGTNLVVLRGTLSRDPEVRALPSGDAVAAFDVTIRPDPADGRTAGPTARAESVPVAWFDPPGASRLGAGDEVVVVGRVRRRFFRAGSSTASRTEVVAERVVPARSTAKVASALAPVAARLGSRR
jgi:single-strand DNA-binding protein